MNHNIEFSRSFYYMEHVLGLNRSLHPSQRTDEVYTIPVVVHVIHNGEAYGSGTNITDEQIFSAIAALNEDFRRMAGTNGFGNGVDVGVEFCLAARNPSGQPTNGIVRVNGSSVANYSTMGIEASSGSGAVEESVKALSTWPRASYMNIWIVNEIENNDGGSGIQGYAYFPVNSPIDGIVLLYNAFGTVGNLKSYTNMNRTLTHEVGHYLGLYHTFNSTSSCTGETNCTTQGDRVCDTPPTIQAGSCSSPACSGTQQVENYMDYTSQTCQDMFTDGQKLRMRTTLETQRTSIMTSMGCMPVYQNDIGVTAVINPTGTNCAGGITPQVTLANFGGISLTSAIIQYNVDGVGTSSYNWSGTLAPGSSTTITLPSINPGAGSHTFYAWASSPNGSSDENAGNNQSTGAFAVTAGAAAELDVILDYYGTETSWIISDVNNTILMSGGPYVNGQQGLHNITPVCLAEGCYTLTMNDLFGDGQGFTNGSFVLTAADGSVLAQGAGNWGDQSINEFCIEATIPQGEAPVASFTVQDNSICRNIPIDFTSTSTQSPTTYSWIFEGGAPATSTQQNPQNISYATAGTFDVTLTVANTFGTNTFTCSNCVTVSADPVVTLTGINPGCNSQATGSITSSVSGTGPYTYSWSNGATTANLTNIAAGNYSVTATSSQGCAGTASTTLSNPVAMVISATTQNATCSGSSNGSIALSVTGGTGNKTYVWNNGSSGANLNNVGAGTYSVTVTDAAGCTAIGSYSITAPSAITISGSATPVSCFGGNNGSIAVSASGGTGNKTFTWNNGATGANLYNLAAGSYSVTATDANGCSSLASFTVSGPSALTVNLLDFDIACNDPSGSASVSPNGGVSPYAVSWSNGTTGNTISNLNAGSYSVTVTDNNGCSANASFQITQSASLSVFLSSANITCNGAGDGQITASVSGGDMNYSYSWSNGSTTSSVDNLSAGSYSLTVTDGAGCSGTASSVIIEPSTLTVTIDASDITCNGQNNGSALALVQGGIAPYQYNWNNGGSDELAEELGAGNISVVVTDANGCEVQAQNTIEQPSILVANVIITGTETCAGNDGSAEVMIDGGIPAYSILWSNGSNSNQLINVAAGIYQVAVTDANGCTIQATAEIGYECEAIIPATQLTQQFCNTSDFGMTGTMACEPVEGAEQYMWRVSTTTGTILIDEFTTDVYFAVSSVPGLQYNSTYVIGIKAKVNGNWGPFGDYCSVTTENIDLPVTGIFESDCGSVITSWGETIEAVSIEGALSYEWHITGNNYDWTAFTTIPTLAVTNDLQLVAGENYQISVRCAFGDALVTNWSEACPFSVALELPVAEPASTEFRFNLYPNPNQGNNLNIEWGSQVSEEGNFKITIRDAAGKQVLAEAIQKNGNSKIQIGFTTPLSSGFYVVEIQDGLNRMEKKLIVN
jgi:PKD repeat protein